MVMSGGSSTHYWVVMICEHNHPSKLLRLTSMGDLTKPHFLCRLRLSKRLTSILTHLAYIANGKKRVILCNNFTGRISVTILGGICDVSYPTKQR